MSDNRIFSVVIPVYRNEESIPALIRDLTSVSDQAWARFGIATEFVFVVDASPDRSHALLSEALPRASFASQLVLHVRNFGSFAAIRTGLQAGRGEFFGVIAADLQEPPGLLIQFLEALLHNDAEVIVGIRESRDDPAASRVAANLFWRLYRRFVIRDMPEGGVDLFGCTRRVRNELLRLRESNSSLVGLIFWLGFRRQEIGYSRVARPFGRSAWTFGKKLNYLLDSVFSFSDLPIRILSALGILGLLVSAILGMLVLILRLQGDIDVPGYAATVITVIFFGALNTLGLGLIGAYAWRTYENTKQRPLAIVHSQRTFDRSTPLTPTETENKSLKIAREQAKRLSS
ncbi:MAG TPA: glycosyltransferase family 2 protein [Rhodopila sp.]|nr:glycosyltransferase family 2 protein [Rhodopila sp.]